MLDCFYNLAHPIREAMGQVTADSWLFGNALIERSSENPGEYIYADESGYYTLRRLPPKSGLKCSTKPIDPSSGIKLVESSARVAVWRIGNLYFRVFRDEFTSRTASHAKGKNWTFIHESEYSFRMSELHYAHEYHDRTYLIHVPPAGESLELLWPSLSSEQRTQYYEMASNATMEFAQNTGLSFFWRHLEGGKEADIYELDPKERETLERLQEKGAQWAQECLEDSWACSKLICVLPYARFECGLGPAENLEFGNVAVIPEGVVVTADGLGIASFQVVGMAHAHPGQLIHNVICPMTFRGSYEGFPHVRSNGITRSLQERHNTPTIEYEGSVTEIPDTHVRPRRTWLTSSRPLAGHNAWKQDAGTGLSLLW